MQAIIDTLRQIDPHFGLHNFGLIGVVSWLFVSVVMFIGARSWLRGCLVPELKPMMIAMASMIPLFAWVGGWQGFAHLPFEKFAILTGVQLALLVLIALLSRVLDPLLGRLVQGKRPADTDLAKIRERWEQQRKPLGMAALVLGLLLAYTGASYFHRYITAEPATATVVMSPAASGKKQDIGFEWTSTDGKKTQIALGYDMMHAFRPKPEQGMQIAFRRDAQPATKRNMPYYTADIGVPAACLYALSMIFPGILMLYSFVRMRRKS